MDKFNQYTYIILRFLPALRFNWQWTIVEFIVQKVCRMMMFHHAAIFLVVLLCEMPRFNALRLILAQFLILSHYDVYFWGALLQFFLLPIWWLFNAIWRPFLRSAFFWSRGMLHIDLNFLVFIIFWRLFLWICCGMIRIVRLESVDIGFLHGRYKEHFWRRLVITFRRKVRRRRGLWSVVALPTAKLFRLFVERICNAGGLLMVLAGGVCVWCSTLRLIAARLV